MEPSSTTSEEQMDPPCTSFALNDDKKLNLITCCICKKTVNKKAKLLPCLHTLCSPCEITGMSEGRLTCQICRYSCVHGDIRDHFLIKYLEDGKDVPRCSVCSHAPIAKFKCSECDDMLCMECSLAHQRVKITKDHVLTELEISADIEDDSKCAKHKGENMLWFCTTCNKATCRDCQLELHVNHQYKSLELGIKDYTDDMHKLLDNNVSFSNSVTALSSLVEQRLSDVAQFETTFREKIDYAFGMIQAKLADRKNELHQSVTEEVDKKRKFYSDVKNETEAISALLRQIICFTDLAKNCPNKLVILQAYEVLVRITNNIAHIAPKVKHGTSQISQPVQLSLNLPTTEIVSHLNQFGKVHAGDNLSKNVAISGRYMSLRQQLGINVRSKGVVRGASNVQQSSTPPNVRRQSTSNLPQQATYQQQPQQQTFGPAQPRWPLQHVQVNMQPMPQSNVQQQPQHQMMYSSGPNNPMNMQMQPRQLFLVQPNSMTPPTYWQTTSSLRPQGVHQQPARYQTPPNFPMNAMGQIQHVPTSTVDNNSLVNTGVPVNQVQLRPVGLLTQMINQDQVCPNRTLPPSQGIVPTNAELRPPNLVCSQSTMPVHSVVSSVSSTLRPLPQLIQKPPDPVMSVTGSSDAQSASSPNVRLTPNVQPLSSPPATRAEQRNVIGSTSSTLLPKHVTSPDDECTIISDSRRSSSSKSSRAERDLKVDLCLDLKQEQPFGHSPKDESVEGTADGPVSSGKPIKEPTPPLPKCTLRLAKKSVNWTLKDQTCFTPFARISSPSSGNTSSMQEPSQSQSSTDRPGEICSAIRVVENSERQTPGASEVTTSGTQSGNPHETDDNRWEEYCSVCQNGGELLCCEGPACTRVFHCYDHIPRFDSVPKETFICGFCTRLEDLRSDIDSVPVEQRVLKQLTPYEQRMCEKILLELFCHVDSVPFHNPVDPNLVEYYEMIKNPMDFSTIRNNLEAKAFKTVEQFVRDLNQVFINCSIFNQDFTETGKAGIEMASFYRSLVQKYCPQYKQYVKCSVRFENKKRKRLLNVDSDNESESDRSPTPKISHNKQTVQQNIML